MLMTPTTATTQIVTNTSGTIAIASSSTSLGAQRIISEAPLDAAELIETARTVITTADMIALASCTILLLSFMWNVFSNKKKRVIEEKFYMLRREEFELEKEKFKQENQQLKER